MAVHGRVVGGGNDEGAVASQAVKSGDQGLGFKVPKTQKEKVLEVRLLRLARKSRRKAFHLFMPQTNYLRKHLRSIHFLKNFIS